jgi:hypothetical protein
MSPLAMIVSGLAGLAAAAQLRAPAGERRRLAARAEALALPPAAVPVGASGALACGALAVGALAIGALAIGALAIGRLDVRKARLRKLEIDELTVRRLHILEPDSQPAMEGSDVD